MLHFLSIASAPFLPILYEFYCMNYSTLSYPVYDTTNRYLKLMDMLILTILSLCILCIPIIYSSIDFIVVTFSTMFGHFRSTTVPLFVPTISSYISTFSNMHYAYIDKVFASYSQELDDENEQMRNVADGTTWTNSFLP